MNCYNLHKFLLILVNYTPPFLISHAVASLTAAYGDGKICIGMSLE